MLCKIIYDPFVCPGYINSQKLLISIKTLESPTQCWEQVNTKLFQLMIICHQMSPSNIRDLDKSNGLLKQHYAGSQPENNVSKLIQIVEQKLIG